MTRISEILNNFFLNLNKTSESQTSSFQCQLFDYDMGVPGDVVEISETAETEEMSETTANPKVSSTTINAPSSKLKIKPYTKQYYQTTTDAIKDSQRNLIGLIRFFEGDPNNHYQAKLKYNDNYGKGTTTYGYGVIDPSAIGESAPQNETQAYNLMLKYLDKVAYKDVVSEFRPPADCSKTVAVHTVKKGDTLAEIAAKYEDISVEDLKRANPGLTVNLSLNQKINIPAKGHPTKEEYYASLPQSVREALLDYSFRNGGSTWRANSKQFKTALDKGLKTNNWVSFLSLLTSSQEKKSEGLSRRGFGRTLLAVRDLPKTKELNSYIERLYNEVLRKSPNYAQDVKDIYDIYKNGKITDPKSPLYKESNKSRSSSDSDTSRANQPETTQPPKQKPQTSQVTHEVVSGDTLSGLAQKYHTTKQAIMKANDLKTENIQIGQKLKIPVTAKQETSQKQKSQPEQITHKVESGDTLLKLAAKYHTTKQAIMDENGLKTDNIQIGQKLKIPR